MLEWLAVMQEEYATLLRDHTWTLVILIPNRQAIGFRVKKKLMVPLVSKYKACLVAKGYIETFALVIKHSVTRVTLILAITHKCPIQQIDVKLNIAFLDGLLSE